MPRKTMPPRIFQRKDGGNWIIRDKGRWRSTGTRDYEAAKEALARYVIEQFDHRQSAPDRLLVSEALELYCKEHAPRVRDPERILYGASALLAASIGTLRVSELTTGACRRYERERNRSSGTIRRELGILQAALNYVAGEGCLVAAPKLKLPPAPPPRDRWLTRDEVARLLWAAYRNPRAKHLARYILVALYTGTRSASILRLRFMPSVDGGWVDVRRGVLYRRGVGESESKKRQPPVPIPRQLLAHLRRWERKGARYVVEIRGCRVASIRTAWKYALRVSGIDHCRPHDLRHTCATWLMQMGADKWAASGFLGISLNMLEKVYGHHHPDFLQSAVQAIESRHRTVSAQFKRAETA